MSSMGRTRREQELQDLWERIRCDPALDTVRSRSGLKLVVGEGLASPKYFVVGEAPGANEARLGRPFIGQSGAVLNQLLALAQIDRERDCWVTNVVKYWPGPGNPTPGYAVQAAFKPHLLAEWRIVGRPRVIFAIGAVAHAAVHPQGYLLSLSACVGKPFEAADGRTTVISMFHPAYGLRGNDARKERLERDWDNLRDELRAMGCGDILD